MIVRELVNLIGFKINEASFRRSEQRVKTFTSKTSQIGKTMGMAFTLPFVGMNTWLLKNLSDFEQLDIAFTTMLGSAEKAKILVKGIGEFAAKTPFEIIPLSKSVKTLIAMRFESENVLDIMNDIGNAAAATGTPIGRIAYNLGQVNSQGRLTGIDLRQFEMAGIDVLGEVLKNRGVEKENINRAKSELRKNVTSVTSKEVIKAFKTMSSKGGIFFNLMIDQSKTLGGLWSNLKDFMTLASLSMRDFLLPTAKKVVKWFLKLTEAFKDMSLILKAVIWTFLAIPAVIAPLLLAFTLLIHLGTFVSGTFVLMARSATAANTSMNMLLLKFGLLALAFIAVIALLVLLTEDIVAFTKGQKSLIGEFLEPWSTLQPKMKAVLDPFLILINDTWENLKKMFNGIIKFIKGSLTDDLELTLEGVDGIVRGFFGGFGDLSAILYGILKGLSKVLSSFIINLLPNLITGLVKGFENAFDSVVFYIIESFIKMFDDIWESFKNSKLGKILTKLIPGMNVDIKDTSGKGFIDQIGNNFKNSVNKFGFNSNFMRTKTIGDQISKNPNRASKTFNINANIETYVPEGTPQFQIDVLRETARLSAEEVFNKNLENLSTNFAGSN